MLLLVSLLAILRCGTITRILGWRVPTKRAVSPRREKPNELELTSKRPGLEGCLHHIDHTGHLAVHVGIRLVEEVQMNLSSGDGHSLEVLRRTVVEGDIPGSRNPAEDPVEGTLGRNLGGIDCMDQTYWLQRACFFESVI